MYLKQYFLGCLAHASYMIADEESKTAAVVDPQRDIGQYLEDAVANGFTIRHVFLTHFHADFVAGHLDLRDRVGAEVHLGAKAEAEYDFSPAREDQPLALGPTVRLGFLETPGHTPEAISILVFDSAQDGVKPRAVLTGDALFIGDVGRPDLMASVGVTSEQLAGMLYDTLHQKLLKLPDDTLLYPAHGAGSLCGKNMSSETVSTIGKQKQFNYACQPMTRGDFIRLVTADQPEAPAYFSYDATMNRREHASLDSVLAAVLRPLSLDEAIRRANAGAQLLDTREPAHFAQGHIAGSVNVGLGGKYATWCGIVLDRARPIVIVADPGRENEAAMRLGRIGFDQIAGYVDGGFAAAAAEPSLVSRVERVTPAQAAERLASSAPPVVVDVRGPGEWEAGHLEGSLNIPLPVLKRSLDDIPAGRPVLLHCQSGYRSMIAASLLLREGVRNFMDLDGGIAAWTKEDRPVAAPVGAGCSTAN